MHGAQQRIGRKISGVEVEEAIARGTIIEDYPQQHHGPAALILGRTGQDRPLHILCSVRPIVDIVTVYEPDLREWEATCVPGGNHDEPDTRLLHLLWAA